MYTWIKDAVIITMDPEQPILNSGHLLIADQEIIYVGSDAPTPQQQEHCQRVIDGRKRLVLPGLINAHTHIGMAPFRNFASDLPLDVWLFEKLFPMEDKLTAEDIHWASQLSIAEMLRTGTTTFADMYMFSGTTADVVADTGIRADLSRGLQCFDDDFDLATDRRIQEAVALLDNYHGAADGRITVRLAPHAVYTCRPRYLQEVAALAKERGVGIHIHLSETAKENADCQAAFGKSPTEHLADLGVLRQPTLAAHGVHLADSDRQLLREFGTAVVHNPGSNLKLGSGVAHVPALLASDVTVALGTDGVASNNNMDMLQEVYLAAVLSKGVFQDSVGVTAHQALEMATVAGAKALGFPDLGQLRAGMKADLVMVDLDQPHYYPLQDPVAALVYAGQGSDVALTMVDGRVLYENGDYTTLDIDRIQWEIERLTEDLFQRR